MALVLESEGSFPLTLNQAKEFRDKTPLGGEREISPERVKFLARLLMDHKFFTPQWGECLYNGERYRVNGNHTSNFLTICLQLGNGGLDEHSREFAQTYLNKKGGKYGAFAIEDLPKLKEGELKVYIERFKADTESDLADCFRRYDNSVSRKTPKDVLGHYLGEQTELKGLENKKVNRVLAGVIKEANANPTLFDFANKAEVRLAAGENQGTALRNKKVRRAVKWIIETVPLAHWYEIVAGSQLFAQIWAKEGEEQGEKIIEEMYRRIKERPVEDWDSALTRKADRPAIEVMLKKGRRVVKYVKDILEENA
jgi:hypothetical protein